MKIITNKAVIECDYEEGVKIIEKFLLIKTIKEIDAKESKGSGNYVHESNVTAEQKELIKKIFTNNPERSVRTVAKELCLTKDQVRYWMKKCMT